MGREFCTLFDSNYLTRGIALARSLERVATDARLTAFCFDDESHAILGELALPNVTTVQLRELEAFDPELLAVKDDRTVAEYCWTATPCTLRYVLKTRPDVMEVTYLDADVRFFSSPEPVFEEMGDASVLIAPHRFPPHLASAVDSTGVYNVQFMTFRHTPDGLTALNWWRERCLEWCYARVEDGKMGDQKYLDDWPARFSGVHVLQHAGGGLAPWNVAQYELGDGPTVDGLPAISFHYHALRLQGDGRHMWRWALYEQSTEVRRRFYDPYFADLDAALADVRRLRPGFDKGFADDVAPRERLQAHTGPARRALGRSLAFGKLATEAALNRVLHQAVRREPLHPFWRSRMALLRRMDCDLVLDVGANAGMYVEGLRANGWPGPAVSLEPLASAFADLEARAASDPAWTARRLALADEAGELELHIAGNSASSSLLPMTDLHTEAAPMSAVVGTETVPVTRLDDVIDEVASGAKRAWLKLDVQGGELRVLEGGRRALDRVAALDVELSLEVLYEGQPDLMDVVTWLRDAGFDLVTLEEAFKHPETGQLLQCDGLFARRLKRY
jgi:FkbM family methyltransferase